MENSEFRELNTKINKKVKPSEEKVWEKYYPEGVKEFTFPKMKTYDLVFEENKNRKDSIALEYAGNEIRYGDFFENVEEKTEYFKSKGVKENDIVTVSMLMTPEFVYDWYALGRLNAISNLIDPRTSPEGIKKYLKEVNSQIVLNTNIFLPKVIKALDSDIPYNVINYSLSESANKMPFVLGLASNAFDLYGKIIAKKDDRLENYNAVKVSKSDDEIIPEYKEKQALTIVHTGGTTGFPKGVVLSHDNYNAMAYEYMKSQIGFSPNDRFLLIMPPWISYGSGMLHMSLVTGMKSTILPNLNSKKMADYLFEYKPQWFAGVPAHYKIIANSKRIEKEKVPFLKAGAVGGDAMSPELYQKVNDYLVENGASQGVYPGYALTEVSSAFAVKQLGGYKLGSVGIPLPGGTVGIFKFDEEQELTLDEELDYNKTGEICLRTPNQMLGYYDNQELTDLVLRKHSDGKTWVHTGDLGHIDEDGFLYVDGRIKEMITRHDGFKIYPAMIEKVVKTHDGVDSCKTVGVEDKLNNHGEIPKTYVIIKPEYQNNEEQVLKEIKEKCAYCLPEYYVENGTYESIEKFPLTALGKVDFQALKNKEDVKVLKKKK